MSDSSAENSKCVRLSQSAKLFQERKGLRLTLRLPAARSNMCRNKVHQLPIQPPAPNPDLIHRLDTGPDSHLTKVWPTEEYESCG